MTTTPTSGAADRRAFYLDAMKDKKNHEALAFELAFLREKSDALTAQAISAEPERTPPTWLTDPAPTRERLFSEWLNSKRDYNVSEVFHGIMQKFASLSAAEPAGVALPSHGHQRAIMEAARNAGLGAYRRVVFLTNGETRIYEHAFTNGWNRRASSGLAPVQQADPSITLDFKQATELLEMFGGEAGLVTLQHGGAKCHSGPGLYAWYSDLPEEGAEFLGAEPDNEAAPQPTPTPQAADTGAAQGAVGVNAEQRRLIGVIADKIEDGTLFRSGIYSNKDLARFVRNVADAAAPQFPTAPAGGEVAYLDIGAGGYLDLGTDLADEALSRLPKGRHALVIAGTYGIDGYTAASTPQSAPPPQAAPAGVLEDAARWHWMAGYIVGTRNDLDDELIASATVDELRKLVDADLAARKQGANHD